MDAGHLAAALTVARVVEGTTLLAAPERALRRTAHATDDHRARVVVRVLGARHLLQAVLSGLHPGPSVLWVGAAVDATHAVTALGLAAIHPLRRRAALVNAVSALAFAAAGAALAHRGARR